MRALSAAGIPSRPGVVLALAVMLAALLACGDGPAPAGDECQIDSACPLGEICSVGECVPGCRDQDDRCPSGYDCQNGVCCPEIDAGVVGDAGADGGSVDAGGSAECPPDMVSIEGRYCIDRWEASRPDATSSDGGDDESRATSRKDVIPWFPVTRDVAFAACTCAGKRLCTPDELTGACEGPDQTTYPYGEHYDPLICNGIDTYCRCGAGSACDGIVPCPYPHCYNSPPEGETSPAGGCTSALHYTRTGAFPGCTNEYGAYDLSGNVWELVDDGSPTGQFRAGAFNCINSELLHECSYHVAPTSVSAKGFRCCRDVSSR